MKILFSNNAWEDYLYWQTNDKAVLKKINNIIKDRERKCHEGIGQPEALKYNLSGWYSQRINLEHRLVYKIENDSIFIAQCRYHY